MRTVVAPSVSIVVISKDEPALALTLDLLAEQLADVVPRVVERAEIVVVDGSSGRLDAIRVARPAVRWIDFTRPEGVRVSIPHQRNRGVRESTGDVVVFTDSGCVPEAGWLAALIGPILSGEERMTCGKTGATGALDPHRQGRAALEGRRYLDECPTINLAFERGVVAQVGEFDESFEYGSDLDFTWRAVHRGIRIRYVPEAVVRHDWGSRRRQVKRSFVYGKARARLYRKHVLGRGDQSVAKRRFTPDDAVPVLYPAYLLGLPVALRHRAYLGLLVVPLWRNRHDHPVRTLMDHMVLAAGVLAGTKEMVAAARASRGARRPTGEVKALFLPEDVNNPYQRLLAEAMVNTGASVAYLPARTPSQTANLALLPLSLLARRLRGFRILHVHWVYLFAPPWVEQVPGGRLLMEAWFVLVLVTARRLGYRIVWTAHNVVPNAQVFADDRAARRRLVRRADAVIAHGSAVLPALGDLGAGPIDVVQAGSYVTQYPQRLTRAEARARLGILPDERVATFVGTITSYKGVDVLLEAVGDLAPRQAVRAVVAGRCGDPDLQVELERLAAAAGDRVLTRFERIPDDELQVYLACADVAVLPYRQITNSSSVLLACSFGLPVLIPALPALADVPDEVAIRFEPGRDGLREALAAVLECDAKELAARSGAARRYADSLSWERAAAATLAIYSRVLGR